MSANDKLNVGDILFDDRGTWLVVRVRRIRKARAYAFGWLDLDTGDLDLNDVITFEDLAELSRLRANAPGE